MTETAVPQQDVVVAHGFVAFLSEAMVLFERSMKKLWRRPVALYFSLIQPVLWMILFGQIFNKIARMPGTASAFGGHSYFQFFVPAVVLQTLLFGAAQSGIGIISDIQSGFLNKLLTTPIHRMAILMGRVMADLFRMILQGVIIVAIAWVAGLFQESHVVYAYGIPGVIAALFVALLFGLGLAGFNVWVALKTKSTESTFLISNFFTLPLMFTSSAQLPVSLLPGWLQKIAWFNPVTYTIDSMRYLMNGREAIGDMAPLPLLAKTIVLLGLVAAVTLTLAVRAFRKAVK